MDSPTESPTFQFKLPRGLDPASSLKVYPCEYGEDGCDGSGKIYYGDDKSDPETCDNCGGSGQFELSYLDREGIAFLIEEVEDRELIWSARVQVLERALARFADVKLVNGEIPNWMAARILGAREALAERPAEPCQVCSLKEWNRVHSASISHPRFHPYQAPTAQASPDAPLK